LSRASRAPPRAASVCRSCFGPPLGSPLARCFDTPTPSPNRLMSDPIIRSRANPLVKRLRALKERGADEDLALVEGYTLLEEALSAGLEVVEAALAPEAARSGRGQALLRELAGHGVPVRHVDAAILSS